MSSTSRLGGSLPFLIGVAGGTASGKSTVCSRIVDRLALNETEHVAIISQDSFYRDLTKHEDIEKAIRGQFNFDHPDAFETPLLISVLKDLKKGKAVSIPKYDFLTQSRLAEGQSVGESTAVVLVEGILIFYDQELRDLFDLKLFVDVDPDIRLARRVERDTSERGRPLTQILQQYLSLVKPAFEEFCLPTKKYADVVVPRGAENDVAIDLIVRHIREHLRSEETVNGLHPGSNAEKESPLHPHGFSRPH